MNDPNEPKCSPTAISVETSSITPITHQEIKPVDGQGWMGMSITQLHRELETMRSRLRTLQEMDKPSAVKGIQQGIMMIESIINEKYKNTDTFI